jgi:hypothetical protein
MKREVAIGEKNASQEESELGSNEAAGKKPLKERILKYPAYDKLQG